MRIKIHEAGSTWKIVRETVVWILFLVILAAAAFGWGVIYENRRFSAVEKDVLLQDQRIKAMNGRLIALEEKKK